MCLCTGMPEANNTNALQHNARSLAASRSNGKVTLLEVTENFWRLSRTAKGLEILSQNFEVTSAE